MRNVVCPSCHESFQFPDDVAAAQCIRCGQALANSTAIEAAPDDWSPPRPERTTGDADTYSSWDDFRSNSAAIQKEMLALAGSPVPDLRSIHVEPPPENAPAKTDDWSRVLATLHVPGEYRYHGLIAACLLVGFALLMITGGTIAIVTPPDAQKRDEKILGPVVFVSGIGALALAVWFGFYRRPPMVATSMWIFEEGVLLNRGGEYLAARWDEVRDYTSSFATGRPLFWLTLNDDVTVVLSVGHCPEVIPLAEYMEIRMAASQLLPRLSAIWSGERVRFGVLTLDRAGITGPRFFAPWSEIRRVITDPQHVFVDTTTRSQWTPFRFADVSFPPLVLAISHVMIEEHGRLAAVDE